MALVDTDDDELLQDDLDDYKVLQRPRELVDLQRKLSGSKSKLIDNKSSSNSTKRRSIGKESKLAENPKGTKLACRHGRKVNSVKCKLPYKSPSSSKSSTKKRVGAELENTFASLLENAKASIAKKRSSKKRGIESANHTGYKVKPDEDSAMTHLKIMGEIAITPQQRYQVLDARDTALRSSKFHGDAKQGNTKKSKVAGCCPDMCPEKERYSRISKNCLSVLEMKTVFDEVATSRDANHRYMVKEYSRSSADQQEPLPHELRPISVLMFTMDYLICNIIDIPLDNITLADWYDFIWNRTRSIRKDITQQQLCDIRCVDIIEKCVRFHIHCSEAMSEEDTSTFDPKINNENLTKCLQTLKHMYQDLLSRGIQCPNEAEFRAYDILLSLTEGETLRLVKDIRKDLLKTPVIQSAFEAALAFKSNNYVKFFKNIEKADYLSSCILHRYILEARVDALQVIVRAYSTQHNASMYPTSNLVRDLKFQDTKEAYEFCRCHNLEGNENYITIDRRQFAKSASGLSLSRSFVLVGSKRNETLGQIIYNGQLPTNPLDWYQPHGSFDNRNLLKPDSLFSTVKEDEKPVKESYSSNDIEQKDANFSNDIDMEDVSTVQNNKSEPIVADVTSEKSPKFKLQNKDADVGDLEKARNYLLNKISRLKHFNNERIKELKSTSSKISHRKEKDKHLHSKAHKSVMFNKDTDSSQPVQGIVKPFPDVSAYLDKSHKSAAVNSNSSNLFGYKDAEFHIPTVTKPVSDTFVTSDTEPVKVPESIVTSASVFFKSAPTSKSGFFSTQHVSSKNFSFHSTLSTPIFPEDSINTEISASTKNILHRSPLNVSTPLFSFSTHPPSIESLNKTPFELSEKDENILLFEKSEAFAPSFPMVEDEPEKEILEDFDDDASSEESVEEAEEMREERSVPMAEDRPEKELLLEEFDDDASSEESVEETEGIREERRELEINQIAEELANEFYTQCIDEFSTSICEEVFNDERIRQAELEDECEILRSYLAQKTILKWRLFCERKCQRRQFQNSTLCSPLQSMLLNTSYFVTGVVSPISAYKKHCILSRTTAQKIKKLQEIPPGWEEFKQKEIWNLTKSKPFPSPYFGKSGISHFFKLCIIFPADCQSYDHSVLFDWICAKFNLSKYQDSELISSNSFLLNDGNTLISIRAIQLGSQMTSRYKEFLDGITAMILCIPEFLNPTDKVTFLNDFACLLDSDTLMYPYPLYVLMLDSQENSRRMFSFLNEKFDAVFFTDMQIKYLSDVKNFIINSKALLDALNWLIEKKKSFPMLQRCDFRYYLEDSFTYAFNVLYCKISLDEFKLLNQMPQHIIDFYNLVLNFRSSTLCSDLLLRLSSSWHPQEVIMLHPGLKFIDKQKQLKCKEKIKLLLLPNFEGDPNSIESVWQYIEDVAILACKDKDMLIIRIKNALDNSNAFPDWLTVINICALHLIYAQDSAFLNPSESLNVYYTKEDLESFECEEFWQDVSADIRKSLLNKTKRKSNASLDSSLKRQKSDVILPEIACDNSHPEEQNYFSNIFDVPDVFTCQRKNLFTSLEAAVAQQKEQSDAFLKHLDETIIAGSVSSNGYHHDLCEQTDAPASNNEIPISDADISFPKFTSSQNSSSQYHTGIEWLDNSLNKSSGGKSFSSIADKLNELKYNIQKSNILEDHFSQLLSKQV